MAEIEKLSIVARARQRLRIWRFRRLLRRRPVGSSSLVVEFDNDSRACDRLMKLIYNLPGRPVWLRCQILRALTF